MSLRRYISDFDGRVTVVYGEGKSLLMKKGAADMKDNVYPYSHPSLIVSSDDIEDVNWNLMRISELQKESYSTAEAPEGINSFSADYVFPHGSYKSFYTWLYEVVGDSFLYTSIFIDGVPVPTKEKAARYFFKVLKGIAKWKDIPIFLTVGNTKDGNYRGLGIIEDLADIILKCSALSHDEYLAEVVKDNSMDIFGMQFEFQYKLLPETAYKVISLKDMKSNG